MCRKGREGGSLQIGEIIPLITYEPKGSDKILVKTSSTLVILAL